ncbi:hypothetical protein [Muricomes intestini]|jgi:hypothetical protein|uniref:FlgN protein n=1 Tax=Muricomes intestini TaxID=1796634 RepID=A0A4V2USU5_9FIRM|nr:hypothetical protein [Muricomes intestini]TCS82808.1 hypothetical protein EDD59_101217 [Muricomes intestini]HAX52801.1 hypothetical protein [Lachnospiraceae bacterium]HCR84258.1 hypothetical protein [Lachnospiraceae bacterium]
MNEFQEVIQKLILLFRDLTAIESKMLEAARGEHIGLLENYMTKEQAFIMQLKGLEKEKDKAQAEAGYKRMSFREILEAQGEEERARFLPLFEELSREVQMFQEVHEDLTVIMEVNLRQINKKLDDTEGHIYSDNTLTGTSAPKSVTSRRV